MRISELADRVGVPTSTVRYYERIGLLGSVPPVRASGYRDYDDDAATRLLFVVTGARDGPELRADHRPASGLGRHQLRRRPTSGSAS